MSDGHARRTAAHDRADDGSAGDADYSRIGVGYSRYRQPEPEIEAAIAAALGDARTVVNVGSYEPVDRVVTAVEPCDPARLDRFWLADYGPEVIATEARRYPAIDRIADALGDDVTCEIVPIPLGCLDGFGEAYNGRPEAFLDPGARRANSAWSFVGDDVEARFEADLRRDLDDGTWDAAHGALRRQPRFDGSLVLIRAVPAEPR